MNEDPPHNLGVGTNVDARDTEHHFRGATGESALAALPDSMIRWMGQGIAPGDTKLLAAGLSRRNIFTT